MFMNCSRTVLNVLKTVQEPFKNINFVRIVSSGTVLYLNFLKKFKTKFLRFLNSS